MNTGTENTINAGRARLGPQVTRNSGIQFIGKIISIGITVAVTMILVRRLPVADYGKYAIAFAFISFFSVLMDFGTMMITTREVSRDPSKSSGIMGNLVTFRLIWSLALMLAAVLSAYMLRYPADLKLLIFIASFTLLFSSFGILEVIFRVNFKMIYSVIAGVAGSLISGIAIIVYIFFPGFSLTGLVIINTFCAAIQGILLFIFSGKFITFKFNINMEQLKNIIKESLPQGVAMFLSAMYFNIDTIIISKLAGEASVAYYSTAYKLLQIIILIPSIVLISVFPLLSKYSGDKSALKLIYQKTCYYLLLMGLPIAAIFTIFSREIITVLYSEKYLTGAPALEVLAWAGAVIFCSSLLGNTLVAINRQNIGMAIAAVGLVLNIGLNLYLIPIYDFFGAAIATVITELFVAVIILLVVYFYGKILPFGYRLVKVLILTVLLSASIVILKKFNLILSIALVVPVYVFLLYVLKCYQEDFYLTDMARSFLKRRSNTGLGDYRP